jgi:DsbC/DsbD-like thiol-disulfide interchange protein
MFKMNKNVSLFSIVGLSLLLNSTLSPGDRTENFFQMPVQARLISEVKSIKPGTKFCIAVRLKMDEGWHTYWKNPGDSGLPTSIEWTLPDGFIADDILWPFPQFFETSDIVGFGYEGEVCLLIDIEAPAALKTGSIVRLSASVEWLACREECVPGRSELTIELPVKERSPEPETRWAEHFANTRKNFPAVLTQWKIIAALNGEKIFIQILPSVPFDRQMTDIVFFPEQERLVEYSEPQSLQKIDSGYSIEIQRSKTAAKMPPRLKGVLYTPQGWDTSAELRALRVDVSLHNN